MLSNIPGEEVGPGLWSSGAGVRYVSYERLVTGSDGQPCLTTGFIPEGQALPYDAAPGNSGGNTTFSSGEVLWPRCLDDPLQVQDPAIIAARYWEQIPLPEPQPYIAPGWAITGKQAFLETNGETRHVYGNATVIGPLEIVATGRYYVDWGDGESTGPYSFEGKPWPDGQITHDYIWAGTYDIVVTERWTATWSLGGRSGVLRELRTTGRIDDFRAEQIQAVVSVN